MTKDTIVQFVCFATNLSADEFFPEWERYTKKFTNKKQEPVLQQQVTETKSKFRYIAQYQWPEQGANAVFVNEKKPDHLPDRTIKIVQIGGYILLQQKRKNSEEEGETRLMAFVSHNETDIDLYRSLCPSDGQLNIYQAYYESCGYGYVLEYFIADADADQLLSQIKQRTGVDACTYKDALIPH